MIINNLTLKNAFLIDDEALWVELNFEFAPLDLTKCSRVDFSIFFERYMIVNPRKCKKFIVPARPGLLDLQEWTCQTIKIFLFLLVINQLLRP